MAKGFGKADRLIEKQRVMSKINSLTPEQKAAAEAACSFDTLTTVDWSDLAKDYAVMCSALIEHEEPRFKAEGGHYYVEDDGTVTGLTFLKHVSTGENIGLVLKQQTPGDAEYHVAEVFTTVASGVTAIPENQLDAVADLAEDLLNRTALAYSFIFDGEERGFRAGYGWSTDHVQDKVNRSTPEGCDVVKPVPVSTHETTTKAIAFAHILNRNAGYLFGGLPYHRIGELLGKENE